MGHLGEFSLSVRLFLEAYRWRTIDPVPWTVPTKPLAACRLGLVSSAGLVPADQDPFDTARRGGDTSFRILADDTDLGALVDTHRSDSFDHSGMMRDPNLVFPIDRARELVARGRLGSVGPRHVSLMGSITAPGRLIRESAPAIADVFASDQVDVALLVPV